MPFVTRHRRPIGTGAINVRAVDIGAIGAGPSAVGAIDAGNAGRLAGRPCLGALAATGIRKEQLDWIELNEAFAAQSLAVIQDLGLDPAKVNPLGGAIALGHPLGATGAVRTATLLHGLRRRRQKYGMVTMCIGTGMGAAGIFEAA